MKLSCRRFEYAKDWTISRLYINDSSSQECYILEGPVRPVGVKVPGHTAIPAGKYEVIVDISVHMLNPDGTHKVLPHLLNVPNFQGIRIHSGNTDADTEGCLLVGTGWSGGDMITNSRDAFNKLFPKIQMALANKETVTIEIVDTNKPVN